MDQPAPLISIIIPTFKRNELLLHGLTSIYAQVVPWDFEVIVLNEYVEDGAKEIAARFPNTRYRVTRPLATAETISWRVPGLAINYGVKVARGRIIIIACPEMYHLDPNNIRNLVLPLLTSKKIMTYTDGLDDRSGLILAKVQMNDQIPFETTINPQQGLFDLNTKYPFFLAMHKEDFLNIGGYDEEFMKGYAYDDTNFTRRMENYGCVYTKVSGKIIHLFHQRLRYNRPDIQIGLELNKKRYESTYNDVLANEGIEIGIL